MLLFLLKGQSIRTLQPLPRVTRSLLALLALLLDWVEERLARGALWLLPEVLLSMPVGAERIGGFVEGSRRPLLYCSRRSRAWFVHAGSTG